MNKTPCRHGSSSVQIASRRSRSSSFASWYRDLSPDSRTPREPRPRTATETDVDRSRGKRRRSRSFAPWHRDLSSSPERSIDEKTSLLPKIRQNLRDIKLIQVVVVVSLVALGLFYWYRRAFSPLTCTHHRPFNPSPGTKYLTYLPHSGLFNQRIALVNALTLAGLLNRTLLLPPLLLGRTTQWLPADQLQAELVLWSAAECNSSSGHARMRWTELISLPGDSRIVERDDLTPFFLSQFGIGDVEHILDTLRYGSRIVEDPSKPVPKGNFAYASSITLPNLLSSSARVLHFGSLDGIDRLALVSSDALELYSRYNHTSVLSNPTLLAASDAIYAALGDDFRAMCLRYGDGPFGRDSTISMDATDTEAALSDPLEGGTSKKGEALYIATDHPDHPLLAPFKANWPNTYFLSNFSCLDEMEAVQAMEGLDGRSIGKWMEKLLDGLVCARSNH